MGGVGWAVGGVGWAVSGGGGGWGGVGEGGCWVGAVSIMGAVLSFGLAAECSSWACIRLAKRIMIVYATVPRLYSACGGAW